MNSKLHNSRWQGDTEYATNVILHLKQEWTYRFHYWGFANFCSFSSCLWKHVFAL